MANIITRSRTGNNLRARDMTATKFHLPTEGKHIINDMVERGFDKRHPEAFAKMNAKVTKMVNDEKGGKSMPTIDYDQTGHPVNDLPRDRTGD